MSAAAVPAPLLLEARTTTHRVARTFSLACRLLPRGVRDDVYLLYLLFRSLDDLVDDGAPDAQERVAAVETWAQGPLAPATQDLYCYRVAGTVGVVMASLLGTRDPAVAHPAAARLGMAMQRTNILRDIDEDRAAGRTYLSREAIARHGPPLPGRRSALMREQIARADALYESGLTGIGQLRSGRVAIAAAAGMYREILRQLEREGLGERAGRAVVPTERKLAVAARAAVRRR
jgi:phytoene synthase